MKEEVVMATQSRKKQIGKSLQKRRNGCFESLNEESKTQVADMVKSIAADPARRIVKEREDIDGLPDVDGVA